MIIDRTLKQISFRKLFRNLLLQYTVASLIITVSIAIVMSVMIISITENHILKMHSSFYINYTSSIRTNYSELLSVFMDEGSEPDFHAIEHFSEDLLLIPSIRNLFIYRTDGEIIWQAYPESTPGSEDGRSLINDALYKDFSYSIEYTDDYNKLNIFLPVYNAQKPVGVIGIEEDIEQTYLSLKSMRQLVLIIIILGGAAFYLLLFYLFYRSYRSQSTAYRKLEGSQRITIHSMSLLAELRDNETGSHILRTSAYCRILAETLREEEEFKKYLTSEYIEDLVHSAPLHDIGKVGVPDNILLKPGKLTDEEFDIIKKHPEMGADVLKKASSAVEIRTFFRIGIQVVLHHHENWDGSGYPDKISGKSIPLSARIMALSDVYDALRTKRPYKEALSHQKAIEIIKSESGKKFDPQIVKAFLDSEQKFLIISADIID